MIWRMNALRARMGTIGAQIADIQTHLNANQQAHLKRGLDFLEHHKRTGSDKDLHTALAERNFATHLYRHFVQVESGGRKRLLTLNLCGRYYMLSLTAQARCLLAGGCAVQAEKLLRGEQATLTTLARVTFEEVIGVTPEVYLDPGFQEHGVTLELLADIYLRAARMGPSRNRMWAMPGNSSSGCGAKSTGQGVVPRPLENAGRTAGEVQITAGLLGRC